MEVLERLHFIGGLAPDADFASGTVYTDLFEVLGSGARFLIWYGTNASVGASTLTIEAADNNSPSNTSAVAFYYRTKVVSSTDIWGAWTAATTAGITVGGAADSAWEIYVDAAELASEGYGYIRAKMVESVAQAADGVITAYVVNPPVQPQSYSLID